VKQQLVLKLGETRATKPPLALDPEILEPLVTLMADAIVAIVEKEKHEGKDDEQHAVQP